MDIGTALFFCEDNMLPFPAYMVTALKTDNNNCIWFFVGKKWNKAVAYNDAVPATMDFYRKGYPFSVTVQGQASLVDNTETVQDIMQVLSGDRHLITEKFRDEVWLVKVKIEKTTCKELIPRKQPPAFQRIKESLKTWWQHAPDNFQPSM